ncbi:amidohydrolase family protein, partial [Pseudoalteromonas sp. 0303]|nr:amidohydrolase family protein [Pseudoalteromonas sp. 0303]
WLSKKPAETFRIDGGELKVGAKADFVVIDLHTEQVIDPNTFVSKGKNTPFAGWTCKGWPTMTIVDGKMVWQKGRGE